MNKQKVVLLIPALNPDEKLIGVVQGLKDAEFQNILVVNDGSSEEYDPIFSRVAEMGCHIFVHHKNLGKGRALKNAYNQIYSIFPDFECVVTLDADGQHLTEDIIQVAEKTMEDPSAIVLGSRAFDKDVPPRSKFGNTITRNVMRIFCGIRIRDTQTGLRGFSRETLPYFLDTPGERYEYETNVLLGAKERNIPIREVTIQTVYIEENKSSHFNPLKDSFRIYTLFLKYILASLASFAIDIGLFALFAALFKNVTASAYIFIATALARAISSLVNYALNKETVFHAKAASKKEVLRSMVLYYVLVVLNVVLSSVLVTLIVRLLSWNETLVKVIVDSVLFVVNYALQRDVVFKTKKKK